jgi:hypothetical protein
MGVKPGLSPEEKTETESVWKIYKRNGLSLFGIKRDEVTESWGK